MPLFWESCRWNPNVHFILATDQAEPFNKPYNLEFMPFTLPDFWAFLGRGIGTEIKPMRPYKLCDFKVTYGLAFQDKLKDFDFWGWCDLDMVWGHIRTFYTDDLLSQYDILTSSHYSINGQCTLFRNVAHVNNLFRKVPDVFDILKQESWWGLDELRLNEIALEEEKAGRLKTLRRQLQVSESWNFWEDAAEHFELKEKGTLEHFPRMLAPCRWEQGRVYHCATGKEMVLHHFLLWKREYPRNARWYPYWNASMTGWEMNEDDILMHFKPGRAGARWLHYFMTRFGVATLNRIGRVIGRCWKSLRPSGKSARVKNPGASSEAF